MIENGLLSYMLGIEVKRQHGEIFISQKKYTREIFEKFKMDIGFNLVNTLDAIGTKLSEEGDGEVIEITLYRSLIGNLKYLTITRPDIVYRVGLVCQYMVKSLETHLVNHKIKNIDRDSSKALKFM